MEKTNATLAEKVQENEQLNKRCLALSSLCGKNKMKWRNNKVLSAYFKKLLNLKKRKFMKKKVFLIFFKIIIQKTLLN